jgi:hypothetical protein
MLLQILQDQLVNIKIGKVLLLKQKKVKFVLLKLFLQKELQQQLKEIKSKLFVTLDLLKILKMK